jgi:hypothetical protein
MKVCGESWQCYCSRVDPFKCHALCILSITDAVFFKVKKTIVFKKIFDAYLQRVGKAPGTLRFVFDNIRILDNATPDSLGMDDEDTVDVLAEQVGGR